MEVIVQVEGRCKRLKLKGSTLMDLEGAFSVMCSGDPVLRSRMITHHPTFKYYSKEYDLDLEIEHGDTLSKGQLIKVFFARYDADDVPPLPQHDDSGPSTISADELEELNFLHSIGTHSNVAKPAKFVATSGKSVEKSVSNQHQTQTQASSSNVAKPAKFVATSGKSVEKSVSNQHQTQTQTQASSKTKRKAKDKSDSDSNDDSNEYLQLSMRSKERNAQALTMLNIVPDRSTLKPKRTKNKRKANKENEAPTRRMPSRAVKMKATNPPHEDAESEREDMEVQIGDQVLDDIDDDDDSGPLGGAATQKKTSQTRRKPEKKCRRMGEKITKFVALPPFPPKLLSCIGQVYKKQTATSLMNEFLKEWILNVTKDLYPTPIEYSLVKTKVIHRLQMVGVSDVSFYENRIVESLSASIRASRSHILNRRPRMQSLKQLAEDKEAETSVEPTPLVQRAESNNIDEHEEILKKPVLNKHTVKLALRSSTARIDKITKTSVRTAMQSYPYLQDAELLICDYCTRVPMQPEEAEKNFEEAVAPIAKIFLRDVPETELEKLKLFKLVDAHYADTQPEDWPAILFCDHKNRNAGALDKIPATQAPAIVIFQDDRNIISAVLVFDGECVTTLKEPLAYQSLQLLLSGYFTFHLEYPKAYATQLEIFEAILHGKKQWPKVTKDFYQKLQEAKEQQQQVP